jgi:hypothetical protein
MLTDRDDTQNFSDHNDTYGRGMRTFVIAAQKSNSVVRSARAKSNESDGTSIAMS